jgi:hypothetical protein
MFEMDVMKLLRSAKCVKLPNNLLVVKGGGLQAAQAPGLFQGRTSSSPASLQGIRRADCRAF